METEDGIATGNPLAAFGTMSAYAPEEAAASADSGKRES